jgi:tetratricopeptide (TPR) repeat protein
MVELFEEANQIWDLSKLYQDIAAIKKHKLTDNEKTWLRGLLCRCSPNLIANQVFWTSASLRTQLSRGLYNYIAVLTNQKRIIWHKIADDLEKLGYKKAAKLQSSILQTTTPLNSHRIVSAFEIIPIVSQLIIGSTPEIAEIAAKAFEQADRLNSLKNYSAALDYYYLGLKSSNSIDIDILISIAGCYDKLMMYDDSLLICYSTLPFISNSSEPSFNQCKLYVFIGSVFEASAIAHKDKCKFKTAIKYYELAASITFLPVGSTYLLPIWNQVSLILLFVKEKVFDQIGENEIYLGIAKEKMEFLLESAQKGYEGGGYSRYRTKILKDMRSSFEGLDLYWQKQYNNFEGIQDKSTKN